MTNAFSKPTFTDDKLLQDCFAPLGEKLLSRETVRRGLEGLLADRDKRRGELAFTYNQSARQMMWLNNQDLMEEMPRWKKGRREGRIKVFKENNKTVQIHGTTWYMMCLTVDVNYDPIAMLGLDDIGIIMSGYCYFFKHEKNRDMTANYIGIAADDE
jgi:hypothetical protein